MENYKEKQKEFKELVKNRAKKIYDSGKITDKKGNVIQKGTPYRKEVK